MLRRLNSLEIGCAVMMLTAMGWAADSSTLSGFIRDSRGVPQMGAVVEIASGLEVDTGRMRENLDTTRGLIMAEAVTFALADRIGKSDAHHLVEAASKKAAAGRRHLRDVLTDDPKVTAHLDSGKIAKLFDPTAYQGVSQTLIDRLLASLENT